MEANVALAVSMGEVPESMDEEVTLTLAWQVDLFFLRTSRFPLFRPAIRASSLRTNLKDARSRLATAARFAWAGLRCMAETAGAAKDIVKRGKTRLEKSIVNIIYAI